MNKIQPKAPTTGKLSAMHQETDVSVPVKYSENLFALWQELASGTTDDGRNFSIGAGGGYIWVTFTGKNELKGSQPRITINLEDLVNAAEKVAVDNDLIITP